jgi:cytochrome P450
MTDQTMTIERIQDWDPDAEDVLRDQRAAYDAMRESCPVAYSNLFQWSVFRHEDVVRVVRDHETFSNAVSSHLSVPNGMDPPEHTAYRQIIEPYFAPAQMEAFSSICRRIAAELVDQARAKRRIEVMDEIARRFAVRAQCAFLGWPAAVEEPLINWTKRSRDATRAQDRQALSQLAREFEAIIDVQLDSRRQAQATPPGDLATSLMNQRVWDRPLSNEEIASILRNWTVGEIGTIAASIGILVHFLGAHRDLQSQVRTEPASLPSAIDEILRIDGPLVLNRRVVKRPVALGGRAIAAGERVSVMWIAANRDGRVFEEPYEFRWDRDTTKNLLYGQGIHACPGAPLARLEMRLFMEELLARTTDLQLDHGRPPIRARYPASGFEEVFVRLAWPQS